jgi:hypothetical protein
MFQSFNAFVADVRIKVQLGALQRLTGLSVLLECR